jgi:hypothetical protein
MVTPTPFNACYRHRLSAALNGLQRPLVRLIQLRRGADGAMLGCWGPARNPTCYTTSLWSTRTDICTISDPINSAAAQRRSLGSEAHRISRPGRSTPNEPAQIEVGLTLRVTSMSASTARRFRPPEICAEAKAGPARRRGAHRSKPTWQQPERRTTARAAPQSASSSREMGEPGNDE